MIKEVYYIGGSPCSGKSTISEMLANKFNLHYFKVDDYLDKYLQYGIRDNKSVCINEGKMSFEESMMRDIEVMVKYELEYYREIFEYIKKDVENINSAKPIIAEGAAFLPELMEQFGVTKDRYICIVPTKQFQVEKYSKREWISHFLFQCADKEKVFNNWMERDAQFAIEVRKQCEAPGYEYILIDGKTSENKIAEIVSKQFMLEK